jgi:alpha-glucosidase
LRDLRALVDEFDDRVLVGETYLPLERVVAYYGHGIHLPFNFQLIGLPWAARNVADLIRRYEAALPAGAWPNWVLGNHDRSRIATRVGAEQARVAAMLLLTLRGTPTLYFGDELGLSDVPIPRHQVQDPWEKNLPGYGLGRDPVRTPMPWTAQAAHAGFTSGQPWLPLNADWRERNVAALKDDASSILTLYRRLLRLRRDISALPQGGIDAVEHYGDVLTYRRSAARTLRVALNLGDAAAVVRVRESGTIVLSTMLDRVEKLTADVVTLRPHEGVIMMLD